MQIVPTASACFLIVLMACGGESSVEQDSGGVPATLPSETGEQLAEDLPLPPEAPENTTPTSPPTAEPTGQLPTAPLPVQPTPDPPVAGNNLVDSPTLRHLAASFDLASAGTFLGRYPTVFEVLTDTPVFVNDVTLERSQIGNLGQSGMCHGMAYLVGFLSLFGEYHPELPATGIATSEFQTSYDGDGTPRLAVRGYADLRSYSSAQERQFRELVDLVHTDRNMTYILGDLLLGGGLARLQKSVAVNEEELASSLAGGRQTILLFLPDDYETAHAVLAYELVRYEKADFFFIYDANVLYAEAQPFATVLKFDRTTESWDWSRYDHDLYGGYYTRIYFGDSL